jgi:hypothetical protein
MGWLHRMLGCDRVYVEDLEMKESTYKHRELVERKLENIERLVRHLVAQNTDQAKMRELAAEVAHKTEELSAAVVHPPA